MRRPVAGILTTQAELDLGFPRPPEPEPGPAPVGSLSEALQAFAGFGTRTVCTTTMGRTFAGLTVEVPTFVNEFWTARQRQASSLHEVSYRACFKPQLPRFFIERLTAPGDTVYDPFMGRGTTPLEAALLGRVPLGNDVNPLSVALLRPRLAPPEPQQVIERLGGVPWDGPDEFPEELLVFYHPDTLRQIAALKKHLLTRRAGGDSDGLDDWITMVALNRLTGHSTGFFSVYTLPPNQATSVKAQQRINARRAQVPPLRDVPAIILKKSRQLLGDCDAAVRRTLAGVAGRARLLTGPAEATPSIPDASVDLVVTSPPFLDVVQYATDNWLRCWFLGIDAQEVRISMPSRLDRWQEIMTGVFRELSRVLRPGGHVAFEVGEVHRGQTRLEEAVLPCGIASGLQPLLILIQAQEFTKTANCWGVNNNSKGTNTNRIVVFRKGD
jgi:hypothetical protein